MALTASELEFVGREVTIGERGFVDDALGRCRPVGGLRLDLEARDEHGRRVVIEVQFGEGDDERFGKITTYAHTVSADLAGCRSQSARAGRSSPTASS